MLIQSSQRNYTPQRPNPVTQEVVRRAGFTDQQHMDRVEWIVDKYHVQSADDYPAAVRRHNSKALVHIAYFADILAKGKYVISHGQNLVKIDIQDFVTVFHGCVSNIYWRNYWHIQGRAWCCTIQM